MDAFLSVAGLILFLAIVTVIVFGIVWVLDQVHLHWQDRRRTRRERELRNTSA